MISAAGLLALVLLVWSMMLRDSPRGLEGVAEVLGKPWKFARGLAAVSLMALVATQPAVRRRLGRSAFPLLLAFLAVAVLSALGSLDRPESFKMLWRELGFYTVVAGLVVAVIDRPSRLRGLLWAVSVLAGMQAAFALAVFHAAIVSPVLAGRLAASGMVYARPDATFAAVGTFDLYNVMTRFLAMGGACQLLLWALGPRGVQRRLLLGLVTLTLWAIVVGQTRTTWVAVAGGLATLALFGHPRALLALVAVPVVLAAAGPMPVRERLGTIADARLWTNPSSNVGQRVIAMQAAVSMVRERPLLGIGYSRHLYEEQFARHSPVPGAPAPSNAHSNLFEFAAEAGLAGLAAYLTLCGGLALLSWRAWRRAATPAGRRLGASMLAIQAMIHSEGLAQFTWKGDVGALLALVLGLLIALCRSELFETLDRGPQPAHARVDGPLPAP